MRGGWKRRLPALLVIAVGLWLWKRGPFPHDRELLWELGAQRASARTLEIQLYGEGDELLKRERWDFAGQEAPAQLLQHVPLAEGRYQARIFVGLADGGTLALEQGVTVTGEEAQTLRIVPGRR